MNELKAFASLSPSLLARKGAAKPAMRPQLHPIHQIGEATARQLEEDLGWNDHGEDIEHPAENASDAIADSEFTAQVVSLSGVDLTGMDVPEVVRHQHAIGRGVEQISPPRQTAASQGRRIAFTLRLDQERHLKLRLAATISNRSAQQIVTEALDRLIEEMPELDALVSRLEDRS
jgi:hypothetical protein